MTGTRGDVEEPTLDLCRPSNGWTAGYNDVGRGFNPRGAPPMNGGADVRWRCSARAIEAVSPADEQGWDIEAHDVGERPGGGRARWEPRPTTMGRYWMAKTASADAFLRRSLGSDGACPLVNPGANERHQEVLPRRAQGQPADEAGTTCMVALGGVDVVGDPSHGVKDAPMLAARLMC